MAFRGYARAFGGIAIATALFSAGACSNGAPGDMRPAIHNDVVAECNDACANCTYSLCADCAHNAPKLLQAFASPVFSCVATADACAGDSTWSDCMKGPIANFPTRSIDTTYENACMAKNQACQGGSGFSSAYCQLTNVMTESTVAALQACLDKSCAELSSCLQQALF